MSVDGFADEWIRVDFVHLVRIVLNFVLVELAGYGSMVRTLRKQAFDTHII